MDRRELASQALDNPVFMDVVEEYEAMIFERWKDSSDAEERERLFIQSSALRELMQRLNEKLMVIKNG